MYCKKCGKEILDEAVICPYCGCETDKKQKEIDAKYNESKTGWGICAGLFLGLIGLVIGLLVYPQDTVARKTFMKSCIITMIVLFIVGFIIGLVASLSY